LYKRLGGPQSRGGLSYGKDYLKDKCEYQYDEYHGSSWYSSETVLDWKWTKTGPCMWTFSVANSGPDSKAMRCEGIFSAIKH
jgi:hypothetical protein